VYSYGLHNVKVQGVSLSQITFEAYQLRVIADGGVIENNSCTIAFLDSIT
tara:strand:+ start:142 stop:291 length:150 start_codon:yes stop_codon:yes gene_type:complete